MKTLIEGGWVVAHNGRSHEVHEHGSVVVEDDKVLHAGGPLCLEKVASGSGEKLQHVVVGPGRRVGHVHHRVDTGDGVGESFTGDGVDT